MTHFVSPKKFLFTTERLAFRPMTMDDLTDLLSLDGNPQVRKFFPTQRLSQEDIIEKIKLNQKWSKQYGFSDWIIQDKNDLSFLGRGGLRPFEKQSIEIGYVLLKKNWGKGFGTEAVLGILKWGFENIPGCQEIIGFTHPDHLNSQKVLEKGGLSYFKTDFYKGQLYKFYSIQKIT
jgi:[ribosomal protein S5]-alanine N-acetyltransferase